MLKYERIKVAKPKKIARKPGTKINASGINFLNWSSNDNEFVIQYKFEIKYPNPNIHPIKKFFDFEFFFNAKVKNNIGNTKKLIK